MSEYCKCDKGYQARVSGYIYRFKDGGYGIIKDFLDDECEYEEIQYCPFCGKLLKGDKR